MNDIVITAGLDEPYTLPYTDPDNEQSLRNLLIGKFAFLGSEAGRSLKNQTLELQVVVDGTNFLNDKLEQIKTPLIWSEKKYVTIDIYDQVESTAFFFELGTFNFNKLTEATNTLTAAGVDIGGITHYQYISPFVNTPAYIKKDSYYEVDENTFLEAFTPPLPTNNSNFLSLPTTVQPVFPFKNDSIIKVTNGASAGFYLSKGPYEKIKLTNDVIGFTVPKTTADVTRWIDSYNLTLDYTDEINKTDSILLNKTILSGVPISSDDLGKLDDPKIFEKYKDNLYADLKVNFDQIKINIPNVTQGNKYFSYPVSSVSFEDSKNLNVGVLFTLDTDKSEPKKLFYTTVLGSSIEVNSSDMKLFVLNPSATEVQSWRSQFAEKQIQLTQRSATLQNYLNELIQYYNYTYDAATNLLRAYVSLLSELSRNL